MAAKIDYFFKSSNNFKEKYHRFKSFENRSFADKLCAFCEEFKIGLS